MPINFRNWARDRKQDTLIYHESKKSDMAQDIISYIRSNLQPCLETVCKTIFENYSNVYRIHFTL